MTKRKHPKDTDYLFLSARLRGMERRMMDRSRMERLLQAPTMAECGQVLQELGYPPFDPASPTALNEALARQRAELFDDLRRQMPDAAVLDVFRLPYDYHNLKTLVKSRGSDVKALLVDAGRISADALLSHYQQSGKWDFLPPAMAQAAAEAERVLAETGDPQRSDFVLDKAYFAELSQVAKDSGSPFVQSYVRTLIDAANLRTLVRTQRMHSAGSFLQQVLFDGGEVSVEKLLAGAGQGVAELYRATALREVAVLGQEAAEGGSLTAFEKACDNAVFAAMARSRTVPFGIEVPMGYIAAREWELTNLRIILSGRQAGLSADAIRERLRDSYV